MFNQESSLLKHGLRHMCPVEIPYSVPNRYRPDQKAVYGFVIYVACYFLFAIYLIWAYVPHDWLRKIGITYIPSQHWAITGPFVIWISFVTGLIVYLWNNTDLVHSVNSIYQIRDMYSGTELHTFDDCLNKRVINVEKKENNNENVLDVDNRDKIHNHAYENSIPIIPSMYDLDYSWVTEQLYLK